MARIRFGHGSDGHRTWLDTAWIQSEHNLILFFKLFDRLKKNLKTKNLNLFKNFIRGVNKNSISFFEMGIRNIYDTYYKYFIFSERFRK